MRLSFRKFLEIINNQRGSVGALGGESGQSGEGDGAGDAGGSSDNNADNSGSSSDNPSPEQALYGELKVQWPEGIEEGLRGEPSLKSFINEKGEVNYANLAKSFVHTKKQMGVDKVILPGENSTDEEINEFYEKLGYKANKEEYTLEAIEESKLDEEFLGKIKDFAHENKIPVNTANKMAQFLNEQANEGNTQSIEATEASIAAGLDEVKTEYGQAFDAKLDVAKRVLNEVVKDEKILEAFNDPAVGSNPNIIRALVNIGEKLYSEDGFSSAAESRNVFSPGEAQEKINEIMGNAADPYHKPDHPAHGDAVKKMMKLFEMKN